MPNLSQAEKELLQRKHEQTIKLRAEFQKHITNPHRHATGEGGHVFDLGMARFQAMRVSNFEHFKPTMRSFRVGMLSVVIPIALFAYACQKERAGRENLYRTGQVAYKDRKFKFI